MKRSTIFLVFALGVATASYLYNAFNTGDFSPGSYGEWVASLWTQLSLSAEATVSDDYTLEATKLVAGFEGFASKAYPDPAGQTKTYSIGYGHQIVPGDGFTSTSTISESDAFALLGDDIARSVACVEGAIDVTQLTSDQVAACISLCYNIGCSGFQSSSVVNDINNGDLESAASAFLLWNKAGGIVNASLVSRRQSESDLFSGGISA